jgi:hypothetical protein
MVWAALCAISPYAGEVEAGRSNEVDCAASGHDPVLKVSALRNQAPAFIRRDVALLNRAAAGMLPISHENDIGQELAAEGPATSRSGAQFGRDSTKLGPDSTLEGRR